ncbi:hypothetical protein DM02DRAFT_521409 [Periconia macrospinosa]|uniref:Carboxymuconolactone decarboxylase-like domain-containing protein n=1 Tax=Periconia macrospinosa TaxID=97972 RepID=A0A2V1E211_9PLEO|nr:hypothetical protein DM02DRAFT_521409 [Periconia macrospinosa]
MSTSNPQPTINPDLHNIFASLEQSFSQSALGSSRWYLVALASLVGGTEPLLADQLYLYLIQKPEYQTPPSRQALVRRIREALVKLISLVGVCKPIEAILAISKIEKEEDRDYTFTREDWQADQANHDRGIEWLQKIYKGNLEDTLDLFNAHRDFRWISTEITYGLYLSDRKVLDDWDTEVVVLAGIAIQNLKLETHWHVRGSRRIGFSIEDVNTVLEGVRRVGGFMEVKLDRLPSVEEVEKDV